MNFWFVICAISFYFSSCDSKKLTCYYGGPLKALKDFEIKFNNVTGVRADGTLIGGIVSSPRKTVVVVHGFTSDYEWVSRMAEKWLDKEKVNFVVIEWMKYSEMPSLELMFVQSALASEFVAEEISEFLEKLVQDLRKNLDFHFVGHSLGAHIAGRAARLLKKNGIKVQRITALDPAFPCFEDDSAELRLKKTDAEFVDVIHTNSEPGKNKGNLGIYDVMGHVDFYPNGGGSQTRCIKKIDDPVEIMKFCNKLTSQVDSIKCLTVHAMYALNVTKVTALRKIVNAISETSLGIRLGDILENVFNGKNVICDHNAAVEYFIESLEGRPIKWANPTVFPVKVNQFLRHDNRRCNKNRCIEMGINAEMYKNYINSRPGYVFYVDSARLVAISSK